MPLRLNDALKPVGPSVQALPQAQQADASKILTELGKGGVVTPGRLRDAFAQAVGRDPARAAVLKALLDQATGGPQTGGKSQLSVRAGGVSSNDPAMKAARALAESRLIAQPAAVDALVRIKSRLESGMWTEGVMPFVFIGPTGVGKSMGVGVLAEILHGDKAKVLEISFDTKKDAQQDASTIVGAGAGYVGYNQETSLSKARIQSIFGDAEPIIINLDDIDKAPKTVMTELLRMFSRFIETGKFELRNGERPFERADGTSRRVVLTMTTNIGTETSKGLSSEALSKHLLQAFRKSMSDSSNDYLMGRLTQGGMVPFGALDAKAMKQIAPMELDLLATKVVGRLRKESDIDLKLSVDPAVTELLAQIGFQPEYGARPLKGVITNMVEDTYGVLGKNARDEDEWRLQFVPGTSADDLRGIRQAFAKTEPGEMPVGVDLPIEFVRRSEKPTFRPYQGASAVPGGADAIEHASGAVGGRSYQVLNAGIDKAKNELVFLKPGTDEAHDKVDRVPLPRELAEAKAMLPILSTTIDETHVMFIGVNYPEKGPAETTAFIYDSETKKFTKAAPPPVALQGAAIAGVNGVAVMFGGRAAARDSDGSWEIPVDASPTDLMGKAVERAAYRYDLATNEWSTVKDWPSQGRMGAAAVARDGKLWFLGGEETFLTKEGSRSISQSRASRTVDVFDPASNKASRSTDLQSPRVFGTPIEDAAGRLSLLGGFDIMDGGRTWDPLTRIDRFNPALNDARWKEIGALPAGASGTHLAAVAHPDGLVVGPLRTKDAFFILARAEG